MDGSEWEGPADPAPVVEGFVALIFVEIFLYVGCGDVGEGVRVKALQDIGC